MIPVLPARDVSEVMRFYVERLGFEVVFQDSGDHPQYAGIRRPARFHGAQAQGCLVLHARA